MLKLATADDIAQHLGESRVLDALERADVRRVPRVVRGPLVDAEPPGAWTLLSWVRGHSGVIDRHPHAARVGAMLRTVHQELAGMVEDLEPLRHYDGQHALICVGVLLHTFASVVALDGSADVLRAGAAVAAGAVDRLWREGVTVLHADVHDGNVVWDGRDPGLIDFGRCGAGPGLLDVAMAQNYLDDATGSELARGYAGPPADPQLMRALRLAAALDNLATLARIPAERAWVEAQLPRLVSRARAVTGDAG